MDLNADPGLDDESAPPVSCSFCGNPGSLDVCTACEVASYCDASCRENARSNHDDLCVKISKQKKLMVESEEELVTKLGGREAFERALKGLNSRADARVYLTRRRNLGLLYMMMSEIETEPHAVFLAETK
jgi:hypothetical protein